MIHFVTRQGAELTLPAGRLANIHHVPFPISGTVEHGNIVSYSQLSGVLSEKNEHYSVSVTAVLYIMSLIMNHECMAFVLVPQP